MPTAHELDAPARLLYRPLPQAEAPQSDWGAAREFGSLREAVHAAMTEEAPAGQEPCIRTGDGTILEGSELQAIFDSLQGP